MTKVRQWTVLTVVAVLVVFAAGWFLLVKPQRSDAAGLRNQAVDQQQANSLLLTQIAALQQQQRSLPQKQRELQRFSTEVPDTPAEPQLIRQLSAAASGAGVDLVSMTPGTASAVTDGSGTAGTTTLSSGTGTVGLTQLPVGIAISGSYPNIVSFFQSLEKLPRALLVSGWTLTTASDGSGGGASAGGSAAGAVPPGTITGTLSANVFYDAPPAAGTTTGSTTTSGSSTTTAPSPAASAATS